MTKRIISLGVLLIMALGILAGCGSGVNDDWEEGALYRVGYMAMGGARSVIHGSLIGGAGEPPFEEIVGSYERWKEIREKDCPSELVKKYNKQFFETKSLAVYAFYRGVWGTQMEITGVSITGNELLVEIDVRLGRAEAISWGIIILEVRKSDTKDVDALRVVENILH